MSELRSLAFVCYFKNASGRLVKISRKNRTANLILFTAWNRATAAVNFGAKAKTQSAEILKFYLKLKVQASLFVSISTSIGSQDDHGQLISLTSPKLSSSALSLPYLS